MARDSKIAPQTAIFQFPDYLINHLHNKTIFSQPSNQSALSKANWNVHDCKLHISYRMKLASPFEGD